MEITQSEQYTERQMKTKQNQKTNIRDLWDNIKHANTRILGVLEGGEREKGIEIMAETS